MKRTAVLAVLAGALFLGGCHKRRWHGFNPEKKADKIASKISRDLDLTDSQKAGLEEIKKDLLASWKQYGDSPKDLIHDLMEQAKLEKLDEAALQKKMTERREKRKGFDDALVRNLIRFHGMLTPEQRQKAVQRLEKFRSKFDK